MCTWCARGRGSRSAARCRSSQLYPATHQTVVTRFRFTPYNLLALLLALVQEVVVNLRGDCLGTQGIILLDQRVRLLVPLWQLHRARAVLLLLGDLLGVEQVREWLSGIKEEVSIMMTI